MANRSFGAHVIDDFSLAGGNRFERLPGIFLRNDDGKIRRDQNGAPKLSFVDFDIFSEDYMRRHLDGMTEIEMNQMEEAYIKVRDQEFSRIEDLIADKKFKLPGRQTLTPVIGNTGAGRSRLIQDMKKTGIVCSTDDFMMAIPQFDALCKEVHTYAIEHGDSAHEYVRGRLSQAVERHRPAAQFMANLMMLESLGNEIPVIAELTGKNEKIATMLHKAQAKGVVVDEAFIVLADAKTCEAGCKRREASYSPIAVSPEQAVFDHALVLANIPAFMAELSGKVKILARYKVNAPLEVVATATKDDYTINYAQLGKYNETFGEGMAIGDLMGSRQLVQHDVAPNRTVVVL
jgi:hypothetical protein